MAKAPVPGRAKTRLAETLGAFEAADVAAAALLDTLAVVREVGAPSVVALTGRPEHCARQREVTEALSWHRVIEQRGTGLGERLANAHADAARLAGADAVVQVGMDTPQLTADLLRCAIAALDGADAALGPAADGGWWSLAVRDADLAQWLVTVPMSRADTGARTSAALERAGARVVRLPELSDVDTLADAIAVAELIPGSRFAAAVGAYAGSAGDDLGTRHRRDLRPCAAFDAALGGEHCEVVTASARVSLLPAQRWLGPSDITDQRLLLSRCAGPTLDVGCGPGRLTAALTARGTLVMGIDVSQVAVTHAIDRGATALRRDVFGPVPALGRWHHVLLADGNVGIGGDPVRLLRRSLELLRKGGTVVVELAEPGTGLRRDRIRLRVQGRLSAPFDWASVGADVVGSLAEETGLELMRLDELAGRWAAVMRRPLAEQPVTA